MAVQGSGVVAKTIGPAMPDPTSYDARSGKPKHPQTTFATTWNMKDQQSASGYGPADPGTGPDGSDPNPLAQEPRVRPLRKQPGVLKATWAMTDANGNGVDPAIAGKVLGEGILSVAAKLPSSATPASGPGPSRS